MCRKRQTPPEDKGNDKTERGNKMAENTYTEEFKTTLMGGFDKEDVLKKVKAIREEAYAEKSKLTLELQNKEKMIAEKDAVIAEKNAEIDRLQKDIKEKYQSYIDNFDTIGQLVYESRIKSEKTISDANAERDRIIAEANTKAQESIDNAQLEVDRKMADGKRRYNVLQEEINELIQLVNQVQHKFMQSFKAIHEISGTMSEEDGTEFDYDESFAEEEEMTPEIEEASAQAEAEPEAAPQ